MTRLTLSLLLSGIFALSAVCLANDDPESKREEQIDLFVALDKNGDGTLQSEEVGDSQRRAFDRLLRVGDADGDGQLTREEYLAGLEPEQPEETMLPDRGRSASRRGPQRLDIGRLFDMADRDRDGRIARDDLSESLRQRLQPLFERIGKDEITREDIEPLRRMAGSPPAGQVGQGRQLALLRLLDDDRDGLLSQSELARVGERFTQIDRNGDDQLDRSELLSYVEGMFTRPEASGRRESVPSSEQMRRPDGGAPSARPDAAMPPLRRPQRSGASPLIRQFDKDGDGALSRDEAPERMTSRFDRLDTNGDDKLTAEELQRAFEFGRRRPQRD